MGDDFGIPRMGFGCFGRTGEEGIAAILYALEVGYRHFDTAQDYHTEREVGEAVRRSGLDRAAVFITTKIDTRNLDRGRLVPSLRRSCDVVGVDQLDLTLIHWPSPYGRVPMADYLEQLAEAHTLGLTRLVGVSNFTIAELTEAIPMMGSIRIATNQVERHPHLQNRRLVDWCLVHGITVTCYLPIARGRLKGDPVLEAIAERHEASVEQVALAWSMAEGLIVIPTSGRHERIRKNYAATRLRLTAEEIAAINTVDRGARQITVPWKTDWD